MAGLGIEYPPPIEDVPIFDPLLFLEADFALTASSADARYLRFPTAQGKETMQDMDVNGLGTFFNGLTMTGALGDNLTNNQNIIMNGTVGKYIQFPDGTQQTTAGGGLVPLVPNPTGTYAYPSSVVVNQYGQTTSVTAGTASIPLTPTGVVATAYTNTNLTVNQYGQITTASNGTAGIPLTPTIVAGSTNFGVAGKIDFNQYGQLTSTTNGILAPNPTGVFTNATVTVNMYGQVTSASSGTPTPPSASNTVPFFSSSGVFPAGASNQSLGGGGLLNLQPQILFDALALTDFDDNTAVTIKFNTSFAFGGASGFYQVGTQVSGMVDFYPKRAVYNVANEAGIYNTYLLNNGSSTSTSGYEFGNIDRQCWAYNINEISGTPQMAGGNVYLQINKGLTGQVIVGLFVTGQTYPYAPATSANATMRVSHSIELVNQGNSNSAFPVKLTIPYLPPPPAFLTVWSDDPTDLYTAVNGKLVYGGFELGTFIP